jgi:hypothetical protein
MTLNLFIFRHLLSHLLKIPDTYLFYFITSIFTHVMFLFIARYLFMRFIYIPYLVYYDHIYFYITIFILDSVRHIYIPYLLQNLLFIYYPYLLFITIIYFILPIIYCTCTHILIYYFIYLYIPICPYTIFETI